jgi:PAS domain-containing protein
MTARIGVEADVKKLLHELQVHQIELEMQNEELREANETAETALKKYTMLYDFAPLGYFTLEKDGSICELNFTGAEMLGDKRFSLVNSNFKLFISESSQPVFNRFFSKVFTSNSKESCEIMLGYDGKPLCSVYMEGVVVGDDKKCLLSVVNISAFKK